MTSKDMLDFDGTVGNNYHKLMGYKKIVLRRRRIGVNVNVCQRSKKEANKHLKMEG